MRVLTVESGMHPTPSWHPVSMSARNGKQGPQSGWDTSTVRNVSWTMHTMATIQLSTAHGGGGVGRSAVLSLGGAGLHARVIEPQGAVFSAAAVDLRPHRPPTTHLDPVQHL
jgi:hypothetical protein